MKFSKEQRVTVPGTQAQGVIMDATETIPCFPVYTLKYLSDAGENECGTIGEGDLAKANPTDADEAKADADAQAISESIERAVSIGVTARLAELRKQRRHKPAKKSAAKRRR